VKLEVREALGKLELVQGSWLPRQLARRLLRPRERDYEGASTDAHHCPADVDLEVRNVNYGAIRVAGVRGTACR
jgi:hypothetical protein